MGSVFHYASVSPSRNAGCLLSFLVDVNLTFPQSPSAQSAYHLSKSLTVDVCSVSDHKCISTPPLNICWINFVLLKLASSGDSVKETNRQVLGPASHSIWWHQHIASIWNRYIYTFAFSRLIRARQTNLCQKEDWQSALGNYLGSHE